MRKRGEEPYPLRCININFDNGTEDRQDGTGYIIQGLNLGLMMVVEGYFFEPIIFI